MGLSLLGAPLTACPRGGPSVDTCENGLGVLKPSTTPACCVVPQVEGRRYQFTPGADVMEGSELEFEAELDKATTW